MPEIWLGEQSLDELSIRRRKSITTQLAAIDPAHRGTAERLWLTLNKTAREELEMHGLLWVGMGDFFKKLLHGDFDAQLFAQLANQALLKALSRLALAAGEFPKTAQMRMGLPLRDEELARTEKKTGANLDTRAR